MNKLNIILLHNENDLLYGEQHNEGETKTSIRIRTTVSTVREKEKRKDD